MKLCSHDSDQVRYFISREKGGSQRRICYCRHSDVQSKYNFCDCPVSVYPLFMTVVILCGKYH